MPWLWQSLCHTDIGTLSKSPPFSTVTMQRQWLISMRVLWKNRFLNLKRFLIVWSMLTKETSEQKKWFLSIRYYLSNNKNLVYFTLVQRRGTRFIFCSMPHAASTIIACFSRIHSYCKKSFFLAMDLLKS